MNNIMKFFKNNWKKLTGILVVAVILVFVYWYGGNAPGTKGFSQEKTTDAALAEESATVLENGDGGADVSQQMTAGDEESSADADGIKADDGNRADNEASNANAVSSEGHHSYDDDMAYESGAGDGDNSGYADAAGDDVSAGKDKDTRAESEGTTTDNPAKPKPNQNADSEQPSPDKPASDKPSEKKPTDTKDVVTPSEETDTTTEVSTQTSKEEEIPSSYPKCTISISCKTILNNMGMLEKAKKSIVPKDGWILQTVTVEFTSGETVFEVLERVTKKYGIQLEYSYTPMYGSYYIEGLYNLYEFDCGNLSGWMYAVNGKFPNFGCSKYVLKDGDVIEWVYTCDLGDDVGNPY